MTHTDSNFFRSKSLNAEWEDLSRSVGDVFLVNEGPGVKAEGRSQISRAHWVDALERKHCAEKYCHKKFSLTERKHHCRRCGEVFCGKCSQFRRRLTLLAQPDPSGISYRVCKSCFDVGPQRLGTSQSHVKDFLHWRKIIKEDGDSNQNKMQAQPSNNICGELERLVDGYKKQIGKSKIKSFVTEALSFVKIPEWQKSEYWMSGSSASSCSLCFKKFSMTETKSNCKVCGAVVCSSCSSETLILFPKKSSQTVQWALINIVGSPVEEPTGCLYLRICNTCHENAALLQGNTFTDGAPVTMVLDDIVNVHQTLNRLQVRICDLLPKYEILVDAVEAKTDLKGLVPVEGSATQTLARYHLDLSDLFTQFAVDMQSIRRLKPQTNTQLRLAKNLTSGMFNFYGDNFPIFRDCKRRTAEIFPEETLEKIQCIVDRNAIRNAYIYIKQLGLEALLLAERYKFDDEIATFLANCESVCLQDLKSQIEACHEDWDQHKEDVKEILQLNLKKHRLIVPSKRLSYQDGAGYVRTFLFDRCGLLVLKTRLQLSNKATEKKFSASKIALQNLSKQLPCSQN